MQSNTSGGIVPRLWARLFGHDAARLKERLQPTHWLSYVLIVAQSATVLLIFGHAEIPLLTTPDWAVRAIAALAVFVLVASVFAADMAMLATLKRMAALARNRQRWQVREHVAYVLFVLITESITLAVVLATLDAAPARLTSPAPLIAPQSPLFGAAIGLRVLLVSWTAIQLVIVRGRLPVLLSTLTATGKEIVGAKVEYLLAQMETDQAPLPALFRIYAAMSQPPRRIRTWWNGWLVRRDAAAEAEEIRQVGSVLDALEHLTRLQQGPAGTGAAAGHPAIVAPAPDLPAPDLPAPRPPTGPGSPVTARARRGRPRQRLPRRPVLRLQPNTASGDEVEQRAAAIWNAQPPRADGRPRLSARQLALQAHISPATASKWAKVFRERDAVEHAPQMAR
jgi:hypothetical protein